jgi:formylglycine-generating enzyme required for sulfatase activity
MLRRSLTPVWIVVILVSGMSFIAQDGAAQTGLCDPDPCQSSPNAVAGTCTEIGGSCVGPSDFFCSCDTGYTWEDATNTCVANPCDPDPCESLENAVPGSCVAVGIDDFTCRCDLFFAWENVTNTCEALCVDTDQDGYYAIDPADCPLLGDDCDDSNEDVYPNAPELCDGVDNQCPGDLCYAEVDTHCGTPTPGMALVPCGCYDMGDHFAEGYEDELPVHNVCISAFSMDLHEVTNAEYAECVDDGACTPPYQTSSYRRPSYYGNPAYDNFPVLHVDWFMADAYCTWAEKRLPTEAEWEYAARGGLAGKRYPWGDTIDCDDACYGRYRPGCDDHCHNGMCDNDTHPVESYAPNGYGLYDMAGNIAEWANDWHEMDYYSVSPPNDPPGPVSSWIRVVRGGSWAELAYALRVASRRQFSMPDQEGEALGFRCARGGAYGP